MTFSKPTIFGRTETTAKERRRPTRTDLIAVLRRTDLHPPLLDLPRISSHVRFRALSREAIWAGRRSYLHLCSNKGSRE
jgi:hypothetical protein